MAFFGTSTLYLDYLSTLPNVRFFNSGVSQVNADCMHDLSGFKLGKLPVRYLGVENYSAKTESFESYNIALEVVTSVFFH